jgi:hypothetical protein
MVLALGYSGLFGKNPMRRKAQVIALVVNESTRTIDETDIESTGAQRLTEEIIGYEMEEIGSPAAGFSG